MMLDRLWNSLGALGAFLGEGIFTVLSIACVIISAVIMIDRINHYKGDMIFTPFRCIFIGAFVSLFIWWLPINLLDAHFKEGFMHVLEAVLESVHGALSLFLLEGGVDAQVREGIEAAVSSDVWCDVHYVFGKTMSVLAPLLTFGFILTFFRNLLNHLAYRTKVFMLRPRVHVFSELNERSLALAESIKDGKMKSGNGSARGEKKHHRLPSLFGRDMIVFTDVFEKNEEEHSDLYDRAHELGAIVFRKDVAAIRFFKKRHHFYLISEDESEEIRHAEAIIDRYAQYKYPAKSDKLAAIRGEVISMRCKRAALRLKMALARRRKESADTIASLQREHAQLGERIEKFIDARRAGRYNSLDAKVYLFSNGSRGKSFLDSYDQTTVNEMALEVVRINDIRSLIYNDLDESGIELFREARQIGNTRVINAVIVGLGMYGLEMLKGLLWYCQMPGYKVNIKAFDDNDDVVSRFRVMCPDIVLSQDVSDGCDMKYSVNISQMNVDTQQFKEAICACKDATFVFVCLGDDGANIATSINIRSWLKQVGKNPKIKTVIYNSGLKNRMTPVINPDDDEKTVKKKKGYDIKIMGDIDSFYSYETVINSSLIDDGFKVHKRWEGENCNPNGFYMFDYGYFSSLANALHRRLKGRIYALEGQDREAFSALLSGDADVAEVTGLVNEHETLWALAGVLSDLYDKRLDAAFSAVGLCRSRCDFPELRDADKARVFEALDKTGLPKIKLSRCYIDALSVTGGEAVESASDIEYAYRVARAFAAVEHVRWNAYMRTEGFVFSENKSASCKMHSDLVTTDKLSFSKCVNDL